MGATESIRRLVRIPADGAELEGAFESPPSPQGVVVFAHGSGSSRMSPRNRFVATTLRRASFATLLLDLLTEAEDRDRERRFDIALLAERLRAAVGWLLSEPAAAGLASGTLRRQYRRGGRPGVAAGLGPRIAAVVSRGGRPDLASVSCWRGSRPRRCSSWAARTPR